MGLSDSLYRENTYIQLLLPIHERPYRWNNLRVCILVISIITVVSSKLHLYSWKLENRTTHDAYPGVSVIKVLTRYGYFE